MSSSSKKRPMLLRHQQMAELRGRLEEAAEGTGEVARVLQHATFSLGGAAFTSLIQMCAKKGQADKALEVAQAMQSVAGLAPNVVHYSALIGALGRAGDWQRAEQLFVELVLLGLEDTSMQPNSVTYAALISGYIKAGQLPKALSLFRQQVLLGPRPDQVDYSCMVTACTRAGDVAAAREVLDMMHSAGYSGHHRLYGGVIAAAVEAGKWAVAAEVFLAMQCAGVTPCSKTCNLMMAALAQGQQAQRALDLLQDCRKYEVTLDAKALRTALQLQVSSDNWQGMLSVLQHIRDLGAPAEALLGL